MKKNYLSDKGFIIDEPLKKSRRGFWKVENDSLCLSSESIWADAFLKCGAIGGLLSLLVSRPKKEWSIPLSEILEISIKPYNKIKKSIFLKTKTNEYHLYFWHEEKSYKTLNELINHYPKEPIKEDNNVNDTIKNQTD